MLNGLHPFVDKTFANGVNLFGSNFYTELSYNVPALLYVIKILT